jgi:hypothetical protein
MLRQLGVPTPTHSLIYAMLKPYIMGPPNCAILLPPSTSEGPLSVDGQVKPALDSDFFHFG